MSFSIGKVQFVIGKGDGWGIGIKFFFFEPSVLIDFLWWYLIIERKYSEQ